ncbi:cell surface protein SprA [Flavobacterium amnicola]|uniref:Cell surface protein SprA n=1 Tax=Flavobacterium amnicola TaxID=2506422 RepID=A0A4Q1K6X3_9FLAO|nr:cell surface protein SprA [Flavobacterium amnicola]RXR21215.1 cell surface protein SprA [Flavobacterium amnicola]
MLFFFVFYNVEAQEVTDTVKGYNTGSLELPNPTSILEAYTYDPATDRYIYTKTFEGFNIDYPIVLTPQEYEKLIRKESIKKYFKEKSDAVAGQKKNAEEKKKDLLPRYYIRSGLFESIFGSNTIDVKPTGSVEIDLGVRFSKQDNPSFSPRNQKSTTFDFDQRISLSLLGQVGTRLKVTANYDTESTFAFQNLIKLEYTPTEDDILQKIEVGNVSMPLNSTLIRGAQSLFGVKAQFQFGRTTFTGVFSEQKSQTKTVTAQGGGTIQEFDLFGLDYDADRHFFLSQYFRNRYDAALKNYPFINSRVQITRMEVWVTNRQNRINTSPEGNNLRNIIALQDLGESELSDENGNDITDQTVGVYGQSIPNFFLTTPINTPTKNANNRFDPALITGGTGLLNSQIREIATSGAGFSGVIMSEGTDYAKLENARKLTPNDFTFHPQLGYISLNQRLANDEVLAVAYQYTIGDDVYQVGEFGTDGVDATVVNTANTPTTQALILKMLKGNLTSVTKPSWNLMMKNIYQIPGAYQLEADGFKFNIVYTDPSPLNYITPANVSSPLPVGVAETPLLKVFNVDKLNANNDPQNGGDGFFDFIPGMTVDPQNGRLIFTTVEPFGKHLFEKLRTSPLQDYSDPISGYNDNQKKYVFTSLYRKTQALALQESEKNKFLLKGKFKSSSGDGISLGASNVPRGSVVVTAGGRVLQEGIDYSVNYQAGRVQILDPSIQASGVPIQVSVENNSVFGQQTRRFMGINVEHKFSEKFQIGATWLKMTERPFTQKSNYGQESINNTIFGANTNFSTEVPFFTRMANKLPFVDTDVPSNLSFRGEVAFLKPGVSKNDQFEGEATVYVDDFEGSQSTIDLKSPLAWTLASAPIGFGGEIPEEDLSYGYKRAKLSWYSIDPIFYTNQRPSGVNDNDLSTLEARRVYSQELYPNTNIAIGETTVVPTLDLTFYPTERGPYNFNPAGVSNTLPNPETNFGGIMRPITSTNFEQANVEYIQFWVQDPYYKDGVISNGANTGELTFNLGEISEDVLKDGRKLYENGLPTPGSTTTTLSTNWGKVPTSQSLIYAFDTNEANRATQDVGLNGLNDVEEANKYPAFSGVVDPAQDNYSYYLSATGTILDRYKKYNGLEGNSPIGVSDTNRGNSVLPDVEDINRDNTMNTINAYYKFSVDIKPNVTESDRYVSNILTTKVSPPLPDGTSPTVRWIQYKIPIQEITPANVEGGISDFRSIRFIRMFMSGFSDKVTLRLGALDLVRGEWRRFNASLETLDADPTDDNTGFDVVGVNLEENSNRTPIRYVMPPGVAREQLYNNNSVVNQNEQSLSLRVYDKTNPETGLEGLESGDSRAAFKNVDVDMRQYNKLKMFLHAEALPGDTSPLQDDQMVGFIRFGNDFTENFYQVEVPLKVTPQTAITAEQIWPLANEVELNTAMLTKLKILNLNGTQPVDANGIFFRNEEELDPSAATKPNKLRLGIKGNPNFGQVRTLMVGVKNRHSSDVRGEVWFNELRLADMDNKGGMAAIASLDTNMADLVTLSATGRMGTIGFGSLEQGPNERSREDMKQYDIVTNVNVGKLLPKKWGMNLPFNYAVGEQVITPEYDPFNQDIKLDQLIEVTADPAEKDNLKKRAQDFTKRTSFNLIGVRRERSAQQKQHFYDPENLTLSYSFSEVEHHDFEIESLIDQQLRTSADYAFTFKPKTIEPFKKTKFMKKSTYWKLLSDFNFNFLPNNVNFSSTILRQYNKQQFRQVEVEGIPLDPLYKRNYMFNYNYGFGYNLAKSLRLNYTATSANLVRNYLDENNNPIDSFTIWDDYLNIGTPNQHAQQLTVNYELPLSKIPFLSFVKSDYTYTGDYSWQKASLALQTIEDDLGTVYNLGNTIQNANTHKLNTSLTMDTFYKYIGFVKRSEKKKKPKTAVAPPPPVAPKPGEKVVAKPKTKEKEIKPNVLVDGLIGVATSIKNIQIIYNETNGTMLPGYLPSIGFLGSSKPSLGFVFGMQDDIRFEAARNGWLTNYPEFNQNFTRINNKQISATANIELFPDLKIDLVGDRTMATNFSEQFDAVGGVYNSHSPYNTGNYSITTNLIRTAFSQSDETTSDAFQTFRDNRIIIANRLAQQRAAFDPSYNPNIFDSSGFPEGYSKNSQAVLLPSFLSAYTGTKASGVSLDAFRSVPIPNWTVKYTGLMRYKFFKDKFRRFSLQHTYKAAYTINSFRSNFEYDKNPNGLDANGNFNNKNIISNINVTEQFSPLMRFDMELKNSIKVLAEMKKDRTLALSFDNSLLTELKGVEYTLGLGYRIKDVTIRSRIADNATGLIKSDINLRGDISFRNNKTIVRNLDYDNNQLGGGQNLISAKLTGDYKFSNNLTTLFYFDYSFTKAVISTSFPITTIRAGFTLRYNFGN